MAGFCLNPKLADEFKQKIISGEIDPLKLSQMSSQDRRVFFAEQLGDVNSEPVNRLFESKLILKNQQRGMINWANKLLGVSPQAKRDIISRIERMDKVLEPHDEQAFLEDLAAWKLGTRVSYEEAQTISELADKVEANESKKGDESYDARMEYGRSLVELQNYVNDLKNKSEKVTFADIRQNPLGEAGRGIGKIVLKGPGFFKAIQSSMDDSALFRQGWKTLWTNPIIWQRNARKSFVDIAKTFGGQNVQNEVQADIQSRPHFELMKQAKLDIGNLEEAFPTTLPEKVPILGRVYKASEAAYTNFLHKTRADVFDKLVDIANRTDVELTEAELINIGRFVNALTGRGYLGSLERAGSVFNNLFFSPKNFKSHIDVLLQPFTGGASIKEMSEGTNLGSGFVRKQAAQSLVKVISATAMILAIAKALDPDSVDEDPRSANFGKIKIRNTRFDVTGGMGSLITLASRMLTQSTKSSIMGEVKPLNEKDKSGKPKFGAPTNLDTLENFLENKLSPVGQVARNVLKDETFDGDRPTVINEMVNLITPLPVKNSIETFKDPNSAPLLATLIADGLGIGTNTYGGSKQILQDLKKARSRGNVREIERLEKALQLARQLEKQKKRELKENR